MPGPAVSYIIASTMRTGSYLLCEGLEYTGVAGHPREIFCPERRGQYAGRWQLPEGVGFEEFLRAGIKQGTTENGVFGTKIHAHHLAALADEAQWSGPPAQVLPRLFPGAKYIHLRRRERRGQAISWYRAEVTNQWWLIHGVQDWDLTGKAPQFDANEIKRRERELGLHDAMWTDFFASEKCEVLEMDYETLAADYRGEVARALSFLRLDAALARDLPAPRLAKQADELTEEWRRRMDAEFPQA